MNPKDTERLQIGPLGALLLRGGQAAQPTLRNLRAQWKASWAQNLLAELGGDQTGNWQAGVWEADAYVPALEDWDDVTLESTFERGLSWLSEAYGAARWEDAEITGQPESLSAQEASEAGRTSMNLQETFDSLREEVSMKEYNAIESGSPEAGRLAHVHWLLGDLGLKEEPAREDAGHRWLLSLLAAANSLDAKRLRQAMDTFPEELHELRAWRQILGEATERRSRWWRQGYYLDLVDDQQVSEDEPFTAARTHYDTDTFRIDLLEDWRQALRNHWNHASWNASRRCRVHTSWAGAAADTWLMLQPADPRPSQAQTSHGSALLFERLSIMKGLMEGQERFRERRSTKRLPLHADRLKEASSLIAAASWILDGQRPIPRVALSPQEHESGLQYTTRLFKERDQAAIWQSGLRDILGEPIDPPDFRQWRRLASLLHPSLQGELIPGILPEDEDQAFVQQIRDGAPTTTGSSTTGSSTARLPSK